MTRQTKADLVWQIATALHVEVPRMSTGSTEPRAIFDLINEGCGLGIAADDKTKPDIDIVWPFKTKVPPEVGCS